MRTQITHNNYKIRARLTNHATAGQISFLKSKGIECGKHISFHDARTKIAQWVRNSRYEYTPKRSNYRRHGWSSGFNGGGCLYEFGMMVYCDDGNGNEWYYGDEY